MYLLILNFLSSSGQGRGSKTNTLLQNRSSEPEWTPNWNVALRLAVITLHYRSVMHGPFLTGWNEQVPHIILAKSSRSCRKSKNTKVLFLSVEEKSLPTYLWQRLYKSSQKFRFPGPSVLKGISCRPVAPTLHWNLNWILQALFFISSNFWFLF